MQRFILAACAILMAAALAAPASAADMARPAYPAPAYIGGYNWTGFYAGLNGGYGFGTTDWTNTGGTSGDFDVAGGLVGGTLGYNMQTGVWVWGLEGDIAASWIKGSTAIAGCVSCETSNSWLATLRGRLGYAMGGFLPFISGGAAFGDIKMAVPGGSESKTNAGWTAGAGVEYAFMGPWSAKIEYLYVDLGKATCSAATCGLDTDVNFRSSIVRAGVNYRF